MIKITKSAREFILRHFDHDNTSSDCIAGLVDTMYSPPDIKTHRIIPCIWAIEDTAGMIKEEIDHWPFMIPPDLFDLLQSTEADLSADGRGLVFIPPMNSETIINRFYRNETK
jgi:hypothetical protein